MKQQFLVLVLLQFLTTIKCALKEKVRSPKARLHAEEPIRGTDASNCPSSAKGDKINVLVTGINGDSKMNSFYLSVKIIYISLGLIGSHVAKELVASECYNVFGITVTVYF